MFKKQTSVSHSSTEAVRISFDAGLRKDGVLTLWDLVIKAFHSVSNKNDGPKRESLGNLSAIVPIKQLNVIQTNIDHIPPNTTRSGHSVMLYVFEDKETLMKMIIKNKKGRSPTMRHVSRTHRVALNWLFDRINNLDPKIQIRYIDTKHQIADILTKGNFRRDEWNNLLHLFNISFQLYLLRKDFQLDKLGQHDGEEDAGTKRRRKKCVQSKLTAMNLSSLIATDRFAWQIMFRAQ